MRSKEDIIEVRRVLEAAGASAKIIAKMETRQSVDNLDAILEVVDGMMVARGDLGVEMRTEDVPMIQKEIIERCRMQGKPVIVATQMLDSMIRNPRPTRAESSDVANAVIDGADAVMLSGETAGGKYPVESVETMNRIIVRTEQDVALWCRKPRSLPAVCETADAVSHAARDVAKEVEAAAIVPLTSSGATARMVSKYRPTCPIIAMTPSLSTWRQLSLVWGVMPCICPITHQLEESLKNAISLIKKRIPCCKWRQRRHNVRYAARRAWQHEYDKRHPHRKRDSARPLACAPPRDRRRLQSFVAAGGDTENL